MRHTRWLLIFVCVASLFTGIGYAQLSGTLVVSGTATYAQQEQDGIYIVSAVPQDPSMIGINGHIGTVMNMQVNPNTRNAVITVTVKNNSDYPQYYVDISADTSITVNADISLGYKVQVGEIGTFHITVNASEVENSVTATAKINFSIVPASIDGGGGGGETESGDNEPTPPGGENNTNALGAVDLILNHVVVGLNHGSAPISESFKNSKSLIFCLDPDIKGGNMENFFKDIAADNIYFVMEEVESSGSNGTYYNLYLYSIVGVQQGDTIAVYKQEIVNMSTDGGREWTVGASYKGYSTVVGDKRSDLSIVDDKRDSISWTPGEIPS